MSSGAVSDLARRSPARRSAFGVFWERLGQDHWLRVWLVLPAVLTLIIFSLYPLAYSLYSSLYSYRLGAFTFAGLSNYQKMLTDRAFWESIGTTLLFSVVVVPSQLIIGLFLPLLLADHIPFRTFYRTPF